MSTHPPPNKDKDKDKEEDDEDDMNRMKHNLVERGLEEYKAGLLYLPDIIMRRGKVCTSKGGSRAPQPVTKILLGIPPLCDDVQGG